MLSSISTLDVLLIVMSIILSHIVYNLFPYSNEEKQNDLNINKNSLYKPIKQLSLIGAKELNDMPYEEFEMIADIPMDQLMLSWKDEDSHFIFTKKYFQDFEQASAD